MMRHSPVRIRRAVERWFSSALCSLGWVAIIACALHGQPAGIVLGFSLLGFSFMVAIRRPVAPPRRGLRGIDGLERL